MKVKLVDLCDIQYGYAFDSAKFTEDSSYPPLVRIRDVKRGYSETYYSGEYPEEYILQAGNLLIGMDGEFNIARWKSRDALLNQRVCKITAKEDASEEYLKFALSKALKEIEARTAFVTVKHLSAKELNKLVLDVPEYSEQVNIAGSLANIEHIIAMRKQELLKLDDLIKARFVEMFGGLEYASEKIGEVSHFIDYRGKTPALDSNGDIRMINAKSVGKGFFKYVNEFVNEDVYKEWMKRGFAKPGDILFVTEGHTFGNTCMIPEELTKFALGQRVITIQVDNKYLNNYYLYCYMQTPMFVRDINKFKTGGTAQGIRSKELINITIPIPPIELQNQFADIVRQVDKSKVAVQEALDKTQLLFDSLMQEYFG